MTWTALTGRVVQCGESQWHFPHKPPNRGGAHDAQGLVLRRVGKIVVATKAGSKRREGRITSKTACRIRILSLHEFTNRFVTTICPTRTSRLATLIIQLIVNFSDALGARAHVSSRKIRCWLGRATVRALRDHGEQPPARTSSLLSIVLTTSKL